MPFKAKGGKGIAAAAIVLAVVLAAAAVLIFRFLRTDPMAMTGKAVITTLRAAKEDSLLGRLGEYTEGAALDMSADLSVTDDIGNPDITVTLKSAGDVKKLRASAELGLDCEGKEIAFSVYSDAKSLSLGCDRVFEGLYGTDFSKAAERLPDSLFAPGSGSFYALNESSYEQALNYIARINKSAELRENARKILSPYALLTAELIKNNASAEKSDGSVSVSDKLIKTDKVLISFDRKAMSTVSRELLSKAAGDEKLKEFLKDCVLVSCPAEEAERLNRKIDEAWDFMQNDLDTIIRAVEDSDLKLSAEFDIGKASKTVISCRFSAKSDIANADIELMIGEDPVEAECILLSGNVDGEKFSLERRLLSSDAASRTTELTLGFKGESCRLKLLLPKKAGVFSAEFENDRIGHFLAEGELEASGSGSVYILNSLTVSERRIPVSIRLAFSPNPAVDIPEFTELLTMTGDEMNALAETVMNSASGLLYDFNGVLHLIEDYLL